MKKSDLLGRWRLIDWVQRYDDGREKYPFGRRPEGFIQYDHDRMFCFMTSAERKPFTGGQWTSPVPEKAGAYDTCLTYSGTYQLDGDEILHEVDMSLYPNWKGTTQRRRARLRDARLYLTARFEEGTSEARTAELVWER